MALQDEPEPSIIKTVRSNIFLNKFTKFFPKLLQDLSQISEQDWLGLPADARKSYTDLVIGVRRSISMMVYLEFADLLFAVIGTWCTGHRITLVISGAIS